eukprot:scaffold4883_cov61-Cylindrotheca_fusiformis.AAC.3
MSLIIVIVGGFGFGFLALMLNTARSIPNNWESAIVTEHGVESYQTHPLPLLLPMADHPPSENVLVPLRHPRNDTTGTSNTAYSKEKHGFRWFNLRMSSASLSTKLPKL